MANNCKFELKQYQVSYDSGTTWQDVVPTQVVKGRLIEYDSPDCSGIRTLYKWRTLEGQYLCDGKEKWTKQIQEESYNDGVTWYTSYPTVYQKGEYIGIDEEFCNDKFVGHYLGGETEDFCPKWYVWNGFDCVYVDPIKVVKCNENPVLTRDEVRYYISYYPLFSAELGDCVTTIGSGSFSGFTYLTSVTISDSVTSIGDSAFNGCSGLTNIELPSGVTSIGEDAFRHCSSLATINIPSSVTSIGDFAFSDCNSLPILGNIRYADTYAIETTDKTLTSYTLKNDTRFLGRGLFSSCTNLTNIEIPDSVISNIGNDTFNGCTSLSSITIGNGVTTIGDYAFTSCRSLTNCTIGSGLTSIGNDAFNGCSSLTSINIPNGVTSINKRTFYGCSSLRRLNSDVDGVFIIPSGVTSIDDSAFDGCNGMTSLTIPSSVIYIGSYAFAVNGLTDLLFDSNTRYKFPTTLQRVTIGNNVRKIQYGCFNGCTSLSSITIGSGVTTIGVEAFYGCSSLTSVTLPSGVTSIGDYAFASCTSLTSVNIQASMGQSVFRDCTSLSSVTIGSGVTSINDNTFYNCSGLTSITINATTPPTLYNTNAFTNTNNCPIYVPCYSVDAYKSAYNWSELADRISGIPPCIETPKCVTYIGGESYSATCNSSSTLTYSEVNIGGSASNITSAIIYDCVSNIGSGAFYNCSSLTSVTIPNSVVSIGDSAFSRCSGLTSIGIVGSGASIEIPSGVTSISTETFRQCVGLTNVVLPDNVTYIGDEAFHSCISLTACTLGSYTTNINRQAFTSCRSLTSIVIPDSVTSIGYQSFASCTSLTSVTIPSGVTTIGSWAFYNCTSLTSITINAATPPSISYDTFENTYCPIYVPSGSVNTYKSASGWSNYSGRIQAIS